MLIPFYLISVDWAMVKMLCFLELGTGFATQRLIVKTVATA
jgi:hypothetical protein